MIDSPIAATERRLAAFLAAVVVAVTLLNGAGVFLKRTGVVDRPSYDQYLSFHRASGPYRNGPLPTARYRLEQPYRTYLFRVEGTVPYLKLLKDAVVLVLLVVSVTCLANRTTSLPSLRGAWPGYLMAGVMTLAFLLTAYRYGILLPLTGLRAFSFLALALIGTWLARTSFTTALTTSSAALLAMEAAAAIFEALRGIPIYGYLSVTAGIPARLMGTFDRPNSLGTWVVLAFAFHISYTRGSQLRWLIMLLTLGLVFASGSATGYIILAILGAGAALKRLGLGQRVLIPAVLAVIVAAFLALPLVTGRPKVFDSLTARFGELGQIVRGFEGLEAASGKALGSGTNTAFQFFRSRGAAEIANHGPVYTAGAESLPSLLLLGTGFPGLAVFYLLLVWAALRDPSGRPFFIALFLTSLTGKVVELFPANLYLAVALARAFAPPDGMRDGSL